MEKGPVKFWDGEKYLFGAAAQQAFIKSRGGWDRHHTDFAFNVLAAKIAVENMNNDFSKTRLKRIK